MGDNIIFEDDFIFFYNFRDILINANNLKGFENSYESKLEKEEEILIYNKSNFIEDTFNSIMKNPDSIIFIDKNFHSILENDKNYTNKEYNEFLKKDKNNEDDFKYINLENYKKTKKVINVNNISNNFNIEKILNKNQYKEDIKKNEISDLFDEHLKK